MLTLRKTARLSSWYKFELQYQEAGKVLVKQAMFFGGSPFQNGMLEVRTEQPYMKGRSTYE
jgi:hypothetical protein